MSTPTVFQKIQAVNDAVAKKNVQAIRQARAAFSQSSKTKEMLPVSFNLSSQPQEAKRLLTSTIF